VAARRAPRFIVEVLFLAALAAALTFADLRPIEIVGLMLLGWLFERFDLSAEQNPQ